MRAALPAGGLHPWGGRPRLRTGATSMDLARWEVVRRELPAVSMAKGDYNYNLPWKN